MAENGGYLVRATPSGRELNQQFDTLFDGTQIAGPFDWAASTMAATRSVSREEGMFAGYIEMRVPPQSGSPGREHGPRAIDEFAAGGRSYLPNPTSTEDGMYTVTSADGTRIAYDRYGEGPAVILVNGALGYRKFKTMEQIAAALSEHCTVINYDRRGRGDSGPAGPASVQHELEDLAALIDALGGQASLWGYSSGSAVALRAAAAALPVEKLVLYEIPFKTDPTAKFPRDDYAAGLEPLIAADDRMGAAKHFLRNVGMPGPIVTVMSRVPMFKRFGANGHTLMFDYLALGDDNMHGSPLRAEEWATVTCPTLVVYGSKTYPSLKHASRSLADVLPNATLRELPGQKHAVKPTAIAPVIAEFVAGSPVAA